MALQLQDPSLFVEKAFIDGKWVSAASSETFDVYDPATGRKLGSCPECGATELNAAFEAANKAFKSWKRLSGRQRGRLLRRWYELLMENKQDLATLIALENGKSRTDAEGEVLFSAGFVEWYSEEAARIYGEVIPHSNASFSVNVVKQPIGVCGMITPWNFPAGMIARKVAPALAAGCTAIVKSDGVTPFSANALAVLAERAGIPAGCFNVITSLQSTPELGLLMCKSDVVRKISFTGSTRVGKILAEQSGSSLKKLSLELGGNAPFIVFPDADLDQALSCLIACKFKVTGQTCVSANRIFVHESIYDDFAERLAAAVSKFRIGASSDAQTTHGPLIGSNGVAKVEQHIKDAVSKNAHIILGGKRGDSKDGSFFEPTILTGVDESMKMAHEETFGPVAALYKFFDEDEVIARANATDVGLASYVMTRDLAKAHRVAAQLETGIVAINTGVVSDSAVPFGGMKHSGTGREGGKLGMEEYLVTKTIISGEDSKRQAHL